MTTTMLNESAVGSVDRHTGLSYDEFVEEYELPGKPVVLLDQTKDWPAMSKWTFDFFKKKYGRANITVKDCKSGERYALTMAKFINYLDDSADDPDKILYLMDWHLAGNCPDLFEDYTPPVYIDNWLDRLSLKFRPEWRWIYIGARNSGTPLHCDVMYSTAWLAVVEGEKRWALFAPEDEPYLYRGDVDAFNPDFDKYPLFRKARPFYYRQSAGEVIYVPSGWWHQVENSETSIALTENVINRSCSNRVRKHLRDSTHADIEAYRILFNRFIPEVAP